MLFFCFYLLVRLPPLGDDGGVDKPRFWHFLCKKNCQGLLKCAWPMPTSACSRACTLRPLRTSWSPPSFPSSPRRRSPNLRDEYFFLFFLEKQCERLIFLSFYLRRSPNHGKGKRCSSPSCCWGGDCFQTAHVKFFVVWKCKKLCLKRGVKKQKHCLKRGVKKQKLCCKKGCEKGKPCLGCCTSWSMGMPKNIIAPTPQIIERIPFQEGMNVINVTPEPGF